MYKSSPPLSQPPPMPTREYLHGMTAGAWLPLAQAGISGGIVAAVILALALYGRARSPLVWAVSGGLLVMGLSWLRLQRHWFRLTSLESLVGVDLDQDGQIGANASPVCIRLQEIKGDGHYQETRYTLPATQEQLESLAAGILRGESFSESVWTGKGRPFSVSEFRGLRAELIRRGLVALANPKDSRQGYAFTVAGRQVLQGFTDSPSPTEQVEIV